MQSIEVAVKEISRVGAWALRGLGIEYGVAQRASVFLAWAEAVEGSTIGRLIDYDLRVKEGGVGKFTSDRRSQDWWQLHSAGRSLLEFGPPVIDVLTYAARTLGRGRFDTFDVFDPVFLTSLCHMAAERGIGIIALSKNKDLSVGGVKTNAIQVRKDRNGAVLFSSIVREIPKALVVGKGWAVEAVSAERNAISLYAYLLSEDVTSLPKSDFEHALEDKLANAYAHGVVVTKEDKEKLYEFEIRTWAPTSDRSRSQALI
jgi:hypothetical protein